MSKLNKKFTITSHSGKNMVVEITDFAKFIGLERTAPDRYSLLLVLQLFGGFKSGFLDIAKVMREIEALEGIGGPSQLKPPILFRHPPLNGLWHKHYLESGIRAVAINVQKRLKKYGIPSLKHNIEESEKANVKRVFTKEDAGAIVKDLMHGNWERLAEAQALTGEWIIYARHEGQNYYLCLARHEHSQHEDIRKQIDAVCCQEFAFLPELLANAEKETNYVPDVRLATTL